MSPPLQLARKDLNNRITRAGRSAAMLSSYPSAAVRVVSLIVALVAAAVAVATVAICMSFAGVVDVSASSGGVAAARAAIICIASSSPSQQSAAGCSAASHADA